VHRDLKPDNLMLTEYADGRPWLKILDFGVARQLAGERIQLTPTGAELGTPHYMSPEQARGETTVDARADVYALGAILYEALSGQHVHAGTSYNEILFQVITQPHVPIAEVLPGCPSGLSLVVERCLAKEPAERPAHAGELLSLFEQLQPSMLDSQTSHPAVTGVSARDRARWQRWLWPTSSIGLAVLLLAWGRRGAEAPPTSTVVAPCSALQTPSAEAAELAPIAAPVAEATIAAAARALEASSTPTPSTPPTGPAESSTPARRPRTRRPPSPTVPSPAAPAPPRSAAPNPSPSGPDLPFATTNPYERRP
jgi:serine/threonine-protein kinase